MLAVWAEMDVVLTDEFRDGNVPAMMAPLTVAKRAFAALPHTVQTYYFRGDSACHERIACFATTERVCSRMCRALPAWRGLATTWGSPSLIMIMTASLISS